MEDIHENNRIQLDAQEGRFSLKSLNNIVANADDEKIDEKYEKGETRIVTEQARYPLNTILNLVKDEKYNLNPEFQRRHRWSIEKKSKLIESFIINVPIPPIFLYEVDFSKYEVMDGLQRLTAISQFYDNLYALTGLEEWKELNGKKYKDLPDKVKAGIDRRYLSSIILLQETSRQDKNKERSLKQLVFERLNSGGEKLKAQETRNAIFPGIFNQKCIELSEDKYFRILWEIATSDTDGLLFQESELGEAIDSSKYLLQNKLYREMEDVELVLRFFAYRQIEKLNQFQTVEVFLDSYLEFANNFPEELVSKLEQVFRYSIKLIYDVFGDKALHLRKPNTKNSPSKVIYDPLCYVISNNIRYSEILRAKKNDIRKDFDSFLKSKSDQFEGRFANRADVIKRINLLSEFIAKYL